MFYISVLDINLAPIAAISDKTNADSPPPRYSEVIESKEDVELGVGAGGDRQAVTTNKWKERFSCGPPNRETMKKRFVVLLVLMIFITFVLSIVNTTRICKRIWYC